MPSNKHQDSERTSVTSALLLGVSAVALCALSVTGTAYAQAAQPSGDNSSATASTDDTIVVTGIRRSLANAQEIKRNSDTVVDAITAQDIGALPDRSVTEALQRVPGVAMNRFAGTNDPDHFSVEGSGVVVRGLNFVRSEFNSRDAFAAGVYGQALNFADVPSELLGGVDVYKNVTAEMIEGGLAGTVNLNTRKPLDNRGFHIGYDFEANYGDMEKKWSPTGSILASNTWTTSGGGTFGLLGDISYSRILSRADGIQVTNFQTRDNTFAAAANNGGTLFACRNPLPAESDTMTLPPANSACGSTGSAGSDGWADFAGTRYAPLGGQFRTQDYDRIRDGQALAGQWESASGNSLITAQFLRSHTVNSWGEHTFETAPDLSEYNTYPVGCLQNTSAPPTMGSGGSVPANVSARCPAPGNTNGPVVNGQPTELTPFTDYQYAADGLFESGYITYPGTGWRTAGSGNGDSNWVPSGGLQQSLSRRQVQEENTVEDYGLNGKFRPTDRIDVNLDVDYTKSEHTNLDVSSFGSTFADEELDLTGHLPVVIPHKPTTLSASWAAPNSVIAGESDAQYFSDPNVQFWRAAMDHYEDSTGHELSGQADVTYHFDDSSFLRRLKAGLRYADRDQTVRYTTYNWGAVSEVWSGSGPPVSIAQSQQFGLNSVDFYSFPDFFRGDTPGPVGGYYYNGDLIKGYQTAAAYFNAISNIWHTTDGSGASTWVPLAARAGVIAGTPFLPSEIQPIQQKDEDAYFMASFGTDSAIPMTGNIGIRWVHTDLDSTGSVGVPTQSAIGVQDPFTTRCTGPNLTGVCSLGATNYGNLQTWATGITNANTASKSYDYALPSLNLKFELTDQLIMRFAASRVMTRPENDYLRNFLTMGVDSSGNITATAGNPYLKPAIASQYDATAEWYFSRVGSLTFDVFYKNVHDFFYQSLTRRDITSNGITESVIVRGPANFAGTGKIKGFEIGYQQTFDFLPGWLSGFGFSGNYSYIDSKGLPNTFLNGGSLANNSTVVAGNLPLEGLSRHNVNATLFYEKGPISLRAAYNWRSRFLLTASDVIFPYYSIFNDATGDLDASAFLTITPRLKIGVQGVNLLNNTTETLQAYTQDPHTLAPRSIFMNDRRFSFILRGSF